MGEVYRARDTTLDREVALKVLPDAFVADPERAARFQREARALAALNHPNVGGIHGIDQANASPLSSSNWSKDQRWPIASPTAGSRRPRR